MSLSARIAVERSRRMTLMVASVSTVGVVVAASTLAARWPASILLFVVLGVVMTATIALVVRRAERDAGSCVLSIAGSVEIELQGGDDGGGPCHLIDPTLSWPGFSMLVLRRDDIHRTHHLPVFDLDLTAADRRSLGRFLAWSLRGGAATGVGLGVR